MSKQEMLYKTLVSKLICNKVTSSEEREKRLFTFYNQSEFYYDVFCESVYMLMTRNSVNTIYLDEFGYTHFEFPNDKIVGYELLSKEDIISYNDDIILYIELALTRLQNQLETLNNIRVIKSFSSSIQ